MVNLVPDVQATLKTSHDNFLSLLRSGPSGNPGVFYDEHKRDELRYLRYMSHCITSRGKDQIQAIHFQLQKLEHQESIGPVSSRALQIDTLKIYLTELVHHRQK